MSIASEITRISSNVSDALTAIAQKGVTVPSGSNSDDLATLIAQISGGGTGAISVVDTTDSHGGTVRTITALDISDTTAVAADVAQGKYFYTAAGVKTAGTGSGGTPSQTQHTIYFEFSDSTNTSITGYWDDSFISSAIMATTPTTYGNKTVTLAQLDGVTWYTKPTETWETLYESNDVSYYPEEDPSTPPYCWIPSLGDVRITQNSVWRVTFDGVLYERFTATYSLDDTNYAFGNPLYLPQHQDDGSGIPFAFYSTDWGAWSGSADVTPNTQHSVKIERLVTS